jgi:hypothetical protein
MPLIASLIKIAALAAALLCMGVVKPMSDSATTRVSSETTPSRLQCRIYFGCTPSAYVATGTARQ